MKYYAIALVVLFFIGVDSLHAGLNLAKAANALGVERGHVFALFCSSIFGGGIVAGLWLADHARASAEAEEE